MSYFLNTLKITILAVSLFLITPFAQAKVEISDGTVKGLWHMEDVADSSGNGMIFSNPNNATFTTAVLNKGVVLASTSQNYLYTADSSYNSLTSYQSYSFWINPTYLPSGTTVVFAKSKGSTERSIECFYYNSAGTRKLQLNMFSVSNGSTYSSHEWSPNFSTSTWYHVVLRIDPTKSNGYKAEMFLNGTNQGFGSVGSNGTFSTIYDGNADFSIGQTDHSALTSGGYFYGKIDEFVSFNTILATSTITSLYNNGTGNEVCLTAGCAATSTPSTGTSTLSSSDEMDGDTVLTYLDNFWKPFFIFAIIATALFGLRYLQRKFFNI